MTIKLHFTPRLTLLLAAANGSSVWKRSTRFPSHTCLASYLFCKTPPKKSALGDVWDAEGGKPARRWWVWDKASGGGRWWSLAWRQPSEVRAKGRQPYSRQDQKTTRWDALGRVDLRQRLAWHPRLRESDAREWAWEVGLPPVGGRTQKSGMNVKGNIKFTIRKKTPKNNPNPNPNQTNP